MTPKEKAEDLVDRYFKKFDDDSGMGWSKCCSKQCALIAVDEILQMVDETMQGWLDADIIAHWEQVKKEIEKL